jgi:hypothetical protein
MTYYLPKHLSPNTITLGTRVSVYEFWKYESIQSTAPDNTACPLTDGSGRSLMVEFL